MIKSTYSLDLESIRRLEAMSKRLGISKSEALRRAIRSTAKDVIDHKSEALLALDELQELLKLSPASVSRKPNWLCESSVSRSHFRLKMPRDLPSSSICPGAAATALPTAGSLRSP